MRYFRTNQTLATAGGVAVLAAGIAFLAPNKAATAVYSSPVSVVNPSTAPAPIVNQDALQSFEASLFIPINSGFGADSTITVPTGKRLVIEYVSAVGSTSTSGRFLDVVITTTTRGINGVPGVAQIFLAPVLGEPTPNGNLEWVVSQPVRAYADAGNVTVGADVTGATAGVNLTVVGHFVNIQ
jgi:hypothetical protein